MVDLHECHFDKKLCRQLYFYCAMSRLETLEVEFAII